MNPTKTFLYSLSILSALACARADEIETPSGIQDSDAYVLETVTPQFPLEMLQRGVEGRALLKLLVSETGEVEKLAVLASTNPVFGKAAMKSVKDWYFEPSRRGGVAVPQVVVVPVDFDIEGVDTPTLAMR